MQLLIAEFFLIFHDYYFIGKAKILYIFIWSNGVHLEKVMQSPHYS